MISTFYNAAAGRKLHSAAVIVYASAGEFARFTPHLTNRKLFRATDFIAELLQHLPDPRLRLIRRYGLYPSRSRGTWPGKPHLVRLAPEGWRQDQAARCALHIGPMNEGYTETSVTTRQSRAAWARLIAKVYEANPLICGHCGSPMRIMAAITEAPPVRKILLHPIKTGKAPPGLDPASLN